MIAIMGLVILKKLYVNLKVGNIRIPFSYQRSNHIHSCCFSRFIESAILLHGIFQFDPAFIQLSLCQTNSTVYAAVSTKNFFHQQQKGRFVSRIVFQSPILYILSVQV